MYGIMQNELKKTPLYFMPCVFECADQEGRIFFSKGPQFVLWAGW